ncbi:MAG: FAD-dependent oxidoreductase [Gammaproteobacteria bacterium]|nr:FAD-dependent oxidoreductase [Gammaproteobacteria bacterium]
MKLITNDFKNEPYWWEKTPRPEVANIHLPKHAEVLIIGAGYTGLSAAIQIARGGREVVVVDAEQAGWGCSSRNGGQVSSSIKPDYPSLSAKVGEDSAFNIIQEGHNALQWIADFIEQEAIDCDFRRVGRYCAAHSQRQFDALDKQLSATPAAFSVDSHMVEKKDQYEELGTDAYYGGMVSTKHASLDPGRYHQGLYEIARDAGVVIIPFCKVDDINRNRVGFEISTAKGKIEADKVVVATSGYTGKATPWHQRRIIPIGSYMIATEEIDKSLMDKLMPKDRVITDTKKLVVYYRSSPDRKRILFGGRVSIGETPLLTSAPRLHQLMVNIFPELSACKISHCWMGFVGYTFDNLPHLGHEDGLYYSMGYCGSGISLSSYMGARIGQQLLGLVDGKTALDDREFQTRPLYRGKPWFLAPSVSYYRIKDKFT